jgi:radical SAM superfamily enzyme YgiQ (UPF0313 family)
MARAEHLKIVILKPSKYDARGNVERFRRGFMPNGTIPYLRSMTPTQLDGCAIETHIIDEYVQTDLRYLKLLHKSQSSTLLALAGVQSHQFQRSLDLAAYALDNGVDHVIIGGPHPMTCDTTMLQNRGVSFALSEAETTWLGILEDAISGQLRPVYGAAQRWQAQLDAPVLIPPSAEYLRRYFVPMIGIYPARGCPFTCNFCSVIKIAGRQIRSQPIETTMSSLRQAKASGVKMIMFTSDNFNKYVDAEALLEAMIEEKIELPFFVQCDTQVVKQEGLIEKLSRAGCFQMFVGVESFNRTILLAAHKAQNHPELYEKIVTLCNRYGIATHFSNIIGFPADTESGIRQHLDTIIDLAPDLASFYILTPIPGTQQYDEFLAKGLIYETNLDRFDATCPTWHHDRLAPEQLHRELFRCYQRFYSISHAFRRGRRMRQWKFKPATWTDLIQAIAAQAFSRFAAFRKMHPMSGGIGRVVLDGVDDYLSLRTKRFGFRLVPLPLSLALSAADSVLNSHAHTS